MRVRAQVQCVKPADFKDRTGSWKEASRGKGCVCTYG